MPCLFLPCSKLRRAPVESYLKFFMGIIGVLGEYLTGYDLVDIPSKKLENNSSIGHLASHEQHSDHSFHSSSVMVQLKFGLLQMVNFKFFSLFS